MKKLLYACPVKSIPVFTLKFATIMQYTTLGNTNLKVSKICLGTMTYGEQNTEAEGHEQMDYAVANGINFFDTAEMYSIPPRPETQGSTERIIGTWLKSRGGRERVIIATKVVGPSPAMRHIRNPLRINREQITQAVEGSMQRLQTDYIDLYQIHWPERHTNYFGRRGYVHDTTDTWQDNFLEHLETMHDLIQAGKIRYWGVSNETPWGLMRLLYLADRHGVPRCVSIQNPYNLLNRTFEIGLAEIAIREQTGLLAYSPLAFGTLSGKYMQGTDRPKDRLNRFKQYTRYNNPQAQQALRQYLQAAEAHGLSLTQMALAFVNSRPFVTSNIIGATNMFQLQENIDSIHQILPAEVLQAIEAVHQAIPDPAP
ncbi:MAG TPA: NADP(H)-dependent aldo-keto reductase [Saprospiraceae bacterium]|nr:NADP(H)-dependent aldo-keto reductase [Saprospiraceae bacterium]HMP13581.1 NADP(H)-dependent aldo-keto reductase [Saprospiraceae bacterium]